jgi:MtN3 and saliva related transmembrane protein
MVEWIGYLAGILTTICYAPQAWHVISTGKCDGISLHAYLMLFAGVALWMIYGICIGHWPLILANGVTLPLVLAIIVMKIQAGQKNACATIPVGGNGAGSAE